MCACSSSRNARRAAVLAAVLAVLGALEARAQLSEPPEHAIAMDRYARCDGLVEDAAGVAAAFAAAGENGSVFIRSGCMPALGSTVSVPRGLTVYCEDHSAGFQPEGRVCIGGLYEGAACTDSGDCHTGGTCTGTAFAPTPATTYTLLDQVAGDAGATFVGCGLSARQVDGFRTCASGPDAGSACRAVCSTNAAGSTTPAVVLGVYLFCDEEADCTGTVGAQSSCIGLADCVDGGVGKCTGAAGAPAGAGNVAVLALKNRATLRDVWVLDVQDAPTLVSVGTDSVVEALDTMRAATRAISGVTATPAADVAIALEVGGGSVVSDGRMYATTSAVKITGGTGAVVRGVLVDDATTAATAIDCDVADCRIVDNRIEAATAAVDVSGQGASIRGNAIAATTTGIRVSAADAMVVGNRVAISGAGYALRGSGGYLTATGNKWTASTSGAACVRVDGAFQYALDANVFNNCSVGVHMVAPAYNLTISDNRFIAASGSHAAQVICEGAGCRVQGNYFNVGPATTLKRCNGSCTNDGTLCTVAGDCTGCTTTYLDACETEPIIWLGAPGGDVATAHAEITDNILYDPDSSDDGSTAIRFADTDSAARKHSDANVSGNLFLSTEVGVDFGDLISGNAKLESVAITNNTFEPGIVTAVRFGSTTPAHTGVRIVRNIGHTTLVWASDWTKWDGDFGAWHDNEPNTITDQAAATAVLTLKADGAIAAGNAVSMSASVAGAVKKAPVDSEDVVGLAAEDCADTETCQIVTGGLTRATIDDTSTSVGARLCQGATTAGLLTACATTVVGVARAMEAYTGGIGGDQEILVLVEPIGATNASGSTPTYLLPLSGEKQDEQCNQSTRYYFAGQCSGDDNEIEGTSPGNITITECRCHHGGVSQASCATTHKLVVAGSVVAGADCTTAGANIGDCTITQDTDVDAGETLSVQLTSTGNCSANLTVNCLCSVQERAV